MKYTTIHHVRPDVPREVRLAIQGGDVDPNRATLNRYYAPAETVLGTAEAGEAYHQAQGETVNREQNGRHMVHSCMAGDVLEMHNDDHVRYWRVDRIGFTELSIDGEVKNAGAMPHEKPLLA